MARFQPGHIIERVGRSNGLIELVLLAFLAFLAARLVWWIAAPASMAAPVVGPSGQYVSAGAPGTAAVALVDLSVLRTENPFAKSEDTQASGLVEDAPETTLNLVLKGVTHSEDGGGTAVIETPSDGQVLVRVGDEIIDGVRLQRVALGKVTISTRGKLESLYQRDPETENAIGSTLETEGGASEAISASASARSASQNSSENVVFVALAGPDALRRAMSPLPVIENDVLTGYRLIPRGDAAAMQVAGLEPQDIVRGVNGRPVSDFNYEEFLEELEKPGDLEFGVERAGETVRVQISFTEDR